MQGVWDGLLEWARRLEVELRAHRLPGVTYARLPLDRRQRCVVWQGPVEDPAARAILLAHELAHVALYRRLSRLAATYLFCAAFAGNCQGFEALSWRGQLVVLVAEEIAWRDALRKLRELGASPELLRAADHLRDRCARGYRDRSQGEARRLAERILQAHDPLQALELTLRRWWEGSTLTWGE